MLKKYLWVATFLLSPTITYAQTTAYVDPTYAGNQAYTGNLGLDFTANQSIVVLNLGAFNSNAPAGFAGTINVGIFTNPGGVQVGPTVTLTGTAGNILSAGDRFDVTNPAFILLPGDYSVVAVGFGAGDNNGNAVLGGFMGSTENTGGGLITFTGNGRYDANTTLDFPPTCLGCPGTPTNLFNAGTFQFQAVAAPTLTKTFATPFGQLNPGDTATVTFMLSNPNPPGASLTGLAFTDTLPAGLVVSTPNGSTGSCGGGTITAAAGTSSITLAGATIAGGDSCTFSVNVTNQTFNGPLTNTTSTVTSNEAPPGTEATADLTVSPLFFLWFFLES